MSAGAITIIMFGSVMVLLLTGVPIAFIVGAVAMAAALLLWGPQSLDMTMFTANYVLRSPLLTALPNFIFMGIVLQQSGIADSLFQAVHKWMGGVRGGLGVGVIIICAVFAAMAGVSAAATLTLGIIAVPALLKRGYDKRLLTGLVQAGGALGFLIPPSVVMIGYAFITGISAGRLFAAGVGPGLLLASMYILYTLIRCGIQKDLGPPIPVEERADLKEKIASLKGVVLPLILITVVLGSIFLGIATPTEAAGVGAVGAIICTAVNRRFSWSMLRSTMMRTFQLMGFFAYIVITALIFGKIYTALGAPDLIQQAVGSAGIEPWTLLIIIQLSFFVLGMFLEDSAILFIVLPVYLPLVIQAGFNPVWFATLYVINMQMAFLTPPFGYNLFYMRSVAPPEISLGDIYRSVWPFIIIQGVALVLVMVFPKIALFLPDLLYGAK